MPDIAFLRASAHACREAIHEAAERRSSMAWTGMTSKAPSRKTEAPFWETKTLAEMTAQEWESLCDGCGRCCLVKLEDEDTERVVYTDLACHMFDGESCRCRDYPNRQREVPDCLQLTPESVPKLGWLPPSCAYRRLAEGRSLPAWHPLITGDPDTVHLSGASVRGLVEPLKDGFSLVDMAENDMDSLMERIVDWPETDVPDAGTFEGQG
jgi:uncharacterized cysteine cluster protein YcgN (CxxCxxCC family)